MFDVSEPGWPDALNISLRHARLAAVVRPCREPGRGSRLVGSLPLPSLRPLRLRALHTREAGSSGTAMSGPRGSRLVDSLPLASLRPYGFVATIFIYSVPFWCSSASAFSSCRRWWSRTWLRCWIAWSRTRLHRAASGIGWTTSAGSPASGAAGYFEKIFFMVTTLG